MATSRISLPLRWATVGEISAEKERGGRESRGALFLALQQNSPRAALTFLPPTFFSLSLSLSVGFGSPGPYFRLIEAGLKLLKDPSVICVEEVYLILQQLVGTVLSSKDCEGLARYSLLSAEILSQSGLALERMRDDAKAMVVTMVDMEASYLTAEFFREILRVQEEKDASLLTMSGKGIKADGGTSEDLHLKQIANHVSAYLGVVCNQLKATIPKAIVHCLVLQAKKSLLDKFVEEVAGKDAESLRRLLGENEEVMQRREACSKRLDLLQTAYRELTVSLSSR